MKSHQITIINSLVLIILGLWGYFAPENTSFTALIPVVAGIALLLLAIPMRSSNRVAAHVVVGLTFLLLLAFIKPLSGSISRNDTMAVSRVLIMMLTCTLALIVYIKSFIDARRQRSSIE